MKDELINQSSLIILSLMNKINNSEDWMKTLNWNLTLEEIEAFCSYYGALPIKMDQTSLESFHQKMRIYYKNSKVLTTKISPYFSNDGELVSKFEEEQQLYNKNQSNIDQKKALYNEVLEDLKHAKNLETVVFIYEVFLQNDLSSEDDILNQLAFNIKKEMEKLPLSSSNDKKSQIESAKKTLNIIAINKIEEGFTEKLRMTYSNMTSLDQEGII